MERIINKNMLNQYKEDMTRYGMYVNLKRSIVDYKDGLKCIHRRLIYTMYHDDKAYTNTVKSARIVGNTLGKYHPHGDAACYGAMKPMTNWYEIMMPLIHGQGNWGSIQGDGAAAMRYTEAKLDDFTLECVIGDLLETPNAVDWSETYDERSIEPDFMAVKVPLLLINGTFGIGYGIKSYLPAHNINDVINATLKLMDNPNASIVLIPDTCQECEIIESDFKSISNNGFGKYVVRGKIDIEEVKYRGSMRQALVIKSLPDMTFLNSVKEKIIKLIDEKKVIQIEDAIDASQNDKITKKTILRYEIILKKGADPNYVKEVLYKNTGLQSSFTVNFEVLDGINLLRMSYKSYLQAFIEFRKVTKFRVYCNRYKKAETKFHEKEAYIKVLESGEIDNIIKTIQKQKTIDDTSNIEYLIKKLDITDLQASYIINANIKKLSKGYLNKYKEEAASLKQDCDFFLKMILNEKLLLQEIREELLLFKSKYGQKRRSTIIKAADVNNIPAGEFKIVITENNYIKKVQMNESINNYKGDIPKLVIKADNRESVLLFDDNGKVFKLPVHKIPFTDKGSNGTDIRTIAKNMTSNINTIMLEERLKVLSEKQHKFYINVTTKQGNIKKLDLDDFLTVPPSGILFIKLDSDDMVISVNIVPEGADLIIYSKNKALRVNIMEVPYQRRNTKGMKAMNTADNIDGVSVINHNTTDIVVITEGGKINRFNILALPTSQRNKSGSKVIKLVQGDNIRDIFVVNVNDSIMILTKNDKYEILVKDIPEGSSISAGKKILSTKNDNIVKCKVIRNM